MGLVPFDWGVVTMKIWFYCRVFHHNSSETIKRDQAIDVLGQGFIDSGMVSDRLGSEGPFKL